VKVQLCINWLLACDYSVLHHEGTHVGLKLSPFASFIKTSIALFVVIFWFLDLSTHLWFWDLLLNALFAAIQDFCNAFGDWTVQK
jgi:hypothetical protein